MVHGGRKGKCPCRRDLESVGDGSQEEVDLSVDGVEPVAEDDDGVLKEGGERETDKVEFLKELRRSNTIRELDERQAGFSEGVANEDSTDHLNGGIRQRGECLEQIAFFRRRKCLNFFRLFERCVRRSYTCLNFFIAIRSGLFKTVYFPWYAFRWQVQLLHFSESCVAVRHFSSSTRFFVVRFSSVPGAWKSRLRHLEKQNYAKHFEVRVEVDSEEERRRKGPSETDLNAAAKLASTWTREEKHALLQMVMK